MIFSLFSYQQAFSCLFHYLKKHRFLVFLNFFLIPCIAFTDLLQPYILKMSVDQFILKDRGDILLPVALILLGVVILEFFFRAIQTYLFSFIGQNIVSSLRKDLFSRIQSLSLTSFYARPFSEFMACLISDMDALDESLRSGVVTIFSDFLIILGIFVVLFCMDMFLAVIVLISCLCLFVILNLIHNQMKSLFECVRSTLLKLYDLVHENLEGLVIVRLFGKESANDEIFEQSNALYKKTTITLFTHDAVLYSLVEMMVFFVISAVLYFSFYTGSIGDGMTMGMLLAFIAYIYKLFNPLKDLFGKFTTLNRALVSLEKVAKLLDEKHSVWHGKTVLKTCKGVFSIQNLSFEYPHVQKKTVLKHLSFEIHPQQILALVGPTGSGKTTLVKILSALYSEYRGDIFLDGQELRSIALSSLRKHIAVLFQESFLLPGSIEFNLTMGARNIAPDRLKKALSLVSMLDRVEELPQNIQTILDPQKPIFSQGESQLIAFARCLLSSAQIVFFDEPTASIDPLTEKKIQKSLFEMKKRKTLFVIAHRLSTVRKADRILFLKEGEICEVGTHQELIKCNGDYSTLFQMDENMNKKGGFCV